jgi:K+-sensing histidine kinase KdpD
MTTPMLQETGPAGIIFRFAMVGALVGLGTLLDFAALQLDINAPYLTFLPVIALCCLIDGFGAGLVAAILSGISLWYFFVPPAGFGIPDRADAEHVAIYLCVCLIVCRIIQHQRRSNDQLAQENFELGYKVFLLRKAGR